MAVSLQIGLKQTQRLALTQALRQSIEMLQLSSIELAETITEELVQNPVLEEDFSSKTSSQDEGMLGELNQQLTGLDSVFEKNEQQKIDFADSSDAGYAGQADADRKQNFIENAIADTISLSEHLLEQVRLLSEPKEVIALLMEIVTSLDENGFFREDKKVFAGEHQVPEEKLEEALQIVQKLDPTGCGVASPQESLLIQAKETYPDDQVLHVILKDYFMELVGLFYDKIARRLQLAEEDIIFRSKLIQNLDPFPGRRFTKRKPRYITPELSVKLLDDKILISFNDDWVPRIRINQYYINLLSRKNIDVKLKEYVKDKLIAAKNLIKNISSRRDTIEKVVSAIMEHQIAFLQKGPGHLKPLVHHEIAEVTGFHESTVSRVTTNKYIQTSWGVFELKYFFVSKLKSDQELGDRSVDEVMRLLEDIITHENHERPYSDEEIVKKMESAGINVARRTIAKYRGILNIASSTKRKRLYMIKLEEPK